MGSFKPKIIAIAAALGLGAFGTTLRAQDSLFTKKDPIQERVTSQGKLSITRNWSSGKAYSIWSEVRASWRMNADSVILVQKKRSARLVGSFGDSVNMVTVKRQVARKDPKGNTYYDFVDVKVDANKFAMQLRPALKSVGLKYLPKNTKIETLKDENGNKRWVFIIPEAKGIFIINGLYKEAGDKGIRAVYNTLELQRPVSAHATIRKLEGGGLVYEDEGQVNIIRSNGTLRGYSSNTQDLRLKGQGNGMSAIVGQDSIPQYWMQDTQKEGYKEFGYCVGRLEKSGQLVADADPTLSPDSTFIYAANDGLTMAAFNGASQKFNLSNCIDVSRVGNPKELNIESQELFGEPVLRVNHPEAGRAIVFIRRGISISDTVGNVIGKTMKEKFLIYNPKAGSVRSLEANGQMMPVVTSDSAGKLLSAKHFVLEGQNDILEIKVEVDANGRKKIGDAWVWLEKYGRQKITSPAYGYQQASRTIKIEDKFSSRAEYERYQEQRNKTEEGQQPPLISGKMVEPRHVIAFTDFRSGGIELTVTDDLTPDQNKTFEVKGKDAYAFSSMVGFIDSVRTIEDYKPEQHMRSNSGRIAIMNGEYGMEEVAPQAIFEVNYKVYYNGEILRGQQWAWYPQGWTTQPLGHFITYTPKFDTYVFTDWNSTYVVQNERVMKYSVDGLRRQANTLEEISGKAIEYWDDQGRRCIALKLYDISGREMQIKSKEYGEDGLNIILPDDKKTVEKKKE